ncbi:hypothetical protein ACNHUP_004477 [Serratia marcescens]
MMTYDTATRWRTPVYRACGGVLGLLVAVAGLASSARAAGPTYALTESHTLTLTVGQDTTVTHTLTPVTGLTEGSVPFNSRLANGTFGGSATQYAIKWDNHITSPDCGTTLLCSRVYSLEDATRYIDALIVPSAFNHTEALGYTVMDLGSATAGSYEIRNMTLTDVRAGTYRMSTTVGVYTP